MLQNSLTFIITFENQCLVWSWLSTVDLDFNLLEFFAVLPVVALHVVKDAGRHVIIVNLYCKLKQGIHQLLVILMQAGEILLAEMLSSI